MKVCLRLIVCPRLNLVFLSSCFSSPHAQLITELYRPDVAIVCIGGHYTMGPTGAAYPINMVGLFFFFFFFFMINLFLFSPRFLLVR